MMVAVVRQYMCGEHVRTCYIFTRYIYTHSNKSVLCFSSCFQTETRALLLERQLTAVGLQEQEPRRSSGTGKFEVVAIGLCCLLSIFDTVLLVNGIPVSESVESTELLSKGRHKVYVNCDTGSDKTIDGSNQSPFLSPMHDCDFRQTMTPFTIDSIDV